MNALILQQIQQLPPLPESAIMIENIYQNPNSTFKEMANVIQKDPLLTADILKAANSPLYGFSREISSVSKAVGLFGMGTIRGFALASIVKQSFKLDLSAYNITNEEFSNFSNMLSALAVLWYVKKDPKILDILSTATFLVEIGKVLISQYIINNNLTEDFSKALQEESTITQAEQKVVDTTTIEVTAALFSHWKFDERLIDVVQNCDTPLLAKNKKSAQSLQVLRTAILLNATLSEQSIQKAKELIAEYNLDLTTFTTIIENIG